MTTKNIDIIVRAKDEASQALDKVGKSMGGLSQKIKLGTDSFSLNGLFRIGIIAKAIEGGFELAKGAAAAFRGDYLALANSIESVPIFGKIAKQAVDAIDYIRGEDTLDAIKAKFDAVNKGAEAQLALILQGQKELANLRINRVNAEELDRVPDDFGKARLEAEQKLRRDLQAIKDKAEIRRVSVPVVPDQLAGDRAQAQKELDYGEQYLEKMKKLRGNGYESAPAGQDVLKIIKQWREELAVYDKQIEAIRGDALMRNASAEKDKLAESDEAYKSHADAVARLEKEQVNGRVKLADETERAVAKMRADALADQQAAEGHFAKSQLTRINAQYDAELGALKQKIADTKKAVGDDDSYENAPIFEAFQHQKEAIEADRTGAIVAAQKQQADERRKAVSESEDAIRKIRADSLAKQLEDEGRSSEARKVLVEQEYYEKEKAIKKQINDLTRQDSEGNGDLIASLREQVRAFEGEKGHALADKVGAFQQALAPVVEGLSLSGLQAKARAESNDIAKSTLDVNKEMLDTLNTISDTISDTSTSNDWVFQPANIATS